MEKYLNKIICGDCVEVMKTMPDNCVDLTVTSPPYDNLRDYKGFTFDFENIAKQLFRITKNGGIVVWVVGDAIIDGGESGSSFKQALKFMELGFKLYDTMIYEKNGPAFPEKNRYSQIFEYMFVFSKGKPKTFNPIKDRKNKWGQSWGKTSIRNKAGELIPKPVIKVNEYGKRFNIWKINNGAGFTTKDKYAFAHPAMFPEKLANDHIISWSNEGDLVFDPFLGGGYYN